MAQYRMTNTFRIKTLGCKVNQCDSQELYSRLLTLGWKECCNGHPADLFIVNTCCVTAQADRKSRQAVRAALRKKNGAKVAVTGCYAGYDRPGLERIDANLMIFDHTQKTDILAWIEGLGYEPSAEDRRRSHGFHHHTRAFLKVQEGCDHRCGYCVVPQVRGPSRSKDINRILKEAGQMTENGHREIVVTGVCLGGFGRDLKPALSLVDLLKALEGIKNLARIRLSSIEPADVTNELIQCIADSKMICPHLHLPFQSGDDEILRDMNKPLMVADYLRLVEKARKAIKSLAVTCDFIVGFPTEKDRHFENTTRFIETICPLRSHLFTFSPRRGVSELCSRAKTSDDILKNRFRRLKTICDQQAQRYMNQFLGKNLEVLFEEEADGVWQGYSQNYIKVRTKEAKGLKNVIKHIKVTRVRQNDVEGEIMQ